MIPKPFYGKRMPAFCLVCGIGLGGCQQEMQPALPEVVSPPVATVTPEEGFRSTIDCAALLAVHESASHGQLREGTPAFNLISYALGKAQEYGQQAGIASAEVKVRYAEQTLGYFHEHEAAPAAFVDATRERARQCEENLKQFEPGAQVEDALRKARAAAEQQP